MNKYILTITQLLVIFGCNSQNLKINNSNQFSSCNRDVYGTKLYIKNLPEYICIPSGYVIDDYVREADLDNDSFTDFLAVKYNLKEEIQKNGDTTYWDFYLRDDAQFKKLFTLSNLVPPYIKDISLEYLVKNKVAESIYITYPRRLDSRTNSVKVNKDTITLAYKFDDSYGKSFDFIYNETVNDWILKSVNYFIGELPSYWWDDNEFYYGLKDDLLIVIRAEPKHETSITTFDLKVAFAFREDELYQLKEFIAENINLKKYQNIEEVNFPSEPFFDLPEEWKY